MHESADFNTYQCLHSCRADLDMTGLEVSKPINHSGTAHIFTVGPTAALGLMTDLVSPFSMLTGLNGSIWISFLHTFKTCYFVLSSILSSKWALDALVVDNLCLSRCHSICVA